MPLAETLAALPTPLIASVGGPPPGDGWLAADAAAGDPAALRPLLTAIGRDFGTERPDIQGTRLVELWAWGVTMPAAVALIGARRLPDVRASNVLLAIGRGEIALRRATFHALPGDPDAGRPDARLAGDEAALLAELRRALIETHLRPLVRTVNGLTRRPARALWRSAADRVANAFEWAGDALGDPAAGHALAARCLRDQPAPLSARAALRTVDGVERHVRDGCCLYWRVEGGAICANCPLTTR